MHETTSPAPSSATALAPSAAVSSDTLSSDDGSRGLARIEALDLVRLLAIVGMMGSHLLATLAMLPDAGWQTPLARVANVVAEGGPSTLFAVVGGCSMVLAARGRLAAGDRRGAVLSGVVRGAVVVLIGLLAGFIPTWAIVVLVPFGVGMMLTAPLMLLGSRALIAITALLTVVGGWLNATVRFDMEIVQEIGNVTPLDVLEPVKLLRGLALTGMYPVITWLPYLLVGVVLMRSLLRALERGRERGWSRNALLAGAGAAILAHAVSWAAKAWALDHGVQKLLVDLHGFGGPARPEPWILMTANPHTGTVTDMVATAGTSVALIGLFTLLLPPTRRLVAPPARALRAAGAAPLTIYTVHLLLTGIALIIASVIAGPEAVEHMPWFMGGVWILLVHIAIAVGLGALLSALGRRGPLEALVSGIVRKAVPRRRAA